MEWFYSRNGQKTGPVIDAQFKLLVSSGQITSETLVWRAGLPGWLPYGRLDASVPPPIPPQLRIWHSKKLLVMDHSAQLPDRCIKCNAQSKIRLKRKLYWHSPAYYLLIVAGVLVYAIVAMAIRKTAVIEVGLCDLHSTKRRNGIWISWGIFALSLVLIGFAISLKNGWPALAGGIGILASLVYAAISNTTVHASRIDERVWLKGACADYLSTFPPTQK
ncbi:DUF4339 domain-containing protein [Pedosphaera parvula]|uniref:GYF domain-containing protein n=1 Tax=Pedosphaera parvula (strain Ellin514) TaxID=320771 RepID=B9XGP6_PEDPL|nr:DUF4339 domain-containing protein [Pedosphaera parvula]EEF61097.1 hypothetical protein Cflav_PD3814 [Pedosphaera parvula Ellin514]